MSPLNRTGPEPLYYQLKEQLRRDIQSGALPPDAPIPSERELTEKHNISRMTVRQALNELVTEGLLYRVQGRGTFVAAPKIAQRLDLRSFSGDMASRGLKTESRLLDKKEIPADEHLAHHLGVAVGAPVALIRRLRVVEGHPMAIETAHLPLARVPGILDENFEKESIFKVLESRYQIVPARAEQSLSPSLATKEEARLLEIASKTPVLMMEGTTIDRQGIPIEFVTGIYRGDRYRFTVAMAR